MLAGVKLRARTRRLDRGGRFAAGLNVYATVARWVLAHAGVLDLPAGLHLIAVGG